MCTRKPDRLTHPCGASPHTLFGLSVTALSISRSYDRSRDYSGSYSDQRDRERDYRRDRDHYYDRHHHHDRHRDQRFVVTVALCR